MSKKCSASVESKPCEKSSFATCDGCRQAFCLPHLNAHQQQLSTQMENIVTDHDLLREEIEKDRTQSAFELPEFTRELKLIDAWENGTLAYITKLINTEAERARNVVRAVMNENRERVYAMESTISEEFDQLKKRLGILSEQIQEKIKNGDYLEPDLHRWSTELNDIKRLNTISQVSTPTIISKLIIGETKKIRLDVLNTLDIQYPEEESSISLEHVNRTKDSKNVYHDVTEKISETSKQKPKANYSNIERSADDNCASETKHSHDTIIKILTEAYEYISDKVEEATRLDQDETNRNKRSAKK